MCHGFLTGSADSGKRLSQAVGFAFQVYLDRVKSQKAKISQSLRQASDISICRERAVDVRIHPFVDKCSAMSPKTKCDSPTIAIQRPHASPAMLDRFERQESFRLPNAQSPFKRQLSLRVSDLPSNIQRQRAFLSAIENHQQQRKVPLIFNKLEEQQPDNIYNGDQTNQNHRIGKTDTFNQSITITSCSNTPSGVQFINDGIHKLSSNCNIPSLSSTTSSSTMQFRSTSLQTPMARVTPYHHELTETIKEETVSEFTNTNRWSQISPTVSELLEADMSTVRPAFKAFGKTNASNMLHNETQTNRSFDEEWVAAANPRVQLSCTNPFMCSNDDMR